MYSQFRVDMPLSHFEFIEETMEKLQRKGKVESYFIAHEISDVVNKEHWQGWVQHNMKDTAYRVYFSKLYPLLGVKQKCFTKVKDIKSYIGYIIDNDNKPFPEHFITNIDDVQALEHTPFREMRKEKQKNKQKQLTFSQKLTYEFREYRDKFESENEETMCDIDILKWLKPYYMRHKIGIFDMHMFEKNYLYLYFDTFSTAQTDSHFFAKFLRRMQSTIYNYM